MLLNIHNEESFRIRNKKFSSEWPFKSQNLSGLRSLSTPYLNYRRSNSRDSDELKTITSLIMKHLDKRLPLSDATKLATMYDPAARGLLRLTDDVMDNMLYDAVHGSTGMSSQCHSSASDSPYRNLP
jgi:hypothetical protein